MGRLLWLFGGGHEKCGAIGVGVSVQVAGMGGVCGTSCCLCMHSMG